MHKMGLLSIITAVLTIAAVAASITPASAEFETSNGKSTERKGKGTDIQTFVTNGSTMKCPRVNDTYILFAPPVKGEQLPFFSGDHLAQLLKWGPCEAFGFEFIGSECEVLYEYTGSSKTATVSFLKACEFKAALPGCTVSISAGTEQTSKGNSGLKTVTLMESSKNLLQEARLANIAYTVTGPSIPCGSSGTNGKYEGTIEGEGITVK